MDNRLKGQDVEIQVIKNGEVVESVTNVRSFELAFINEVTEEQYVGETSPRFDVFSKGFRGKIEINLSDGSLFLAGFRAQARTRLPGTRINVKATLQYPNGTRQRLLLTGCVFEDVPFTWGARSEYGTVSLSFKSTDGRVITT